ncbi:helix-turn-helix domain-containing protein [Aurantiacibacter poecillastricola]|uniref:helix-turn-helix domain-containing protein n=1 Tax=Aurantiacibacter poecillastricola TaxID=3064385 RepID=UPI00273F23A0|nr:helix-turn-helix domain-containing protein [Aurantiacibacter sp. 219JJ12-13]MDP5260997.1 helix-turn-helix domain-containing protein [Aurantiacibacter sp. 219JJ12-13]
MDVTQQFEAEIRQLRTREVPGTSRRLRELFDYFAARGAEAESASQAEIAREVFGQDDTDADDASVRVYVHRLRKRLEDHYAAGGGEGQARIVLPSGVYAFRLEGVEAPASEPAPRPGSYRANRPSTLIAAGVALAALALVAAFAWTQRPAAPNSLWAPLAASERPVLLVLGDYYIYGEIDPVRPEQSRLIRDFRVDDESDLAALQEAEPERYGTAEDVGLTYLPFSAAYGLEHVMPVLAEAGKEVEVIAASALEPDMLNRFDVVYVGLLSGMGLLEDQAFATSSLRIGESYDELVDRDTGQVWTSDEARSLASPAFYRDYAYLARFTASTGAEVVVIASERETGLRGISPIAVGDLPEEIEAVSGGAGFEALVQVTGQQGADLDDRLILARERR